MSRSAAFDAFYRDCRARLLHQTYAYVGDADVARAAVSDAFVAAGHHWRKLVTNPDREGWVRQRAFRAADHARRGSARASTSGEPADAHALLVAMGSLSPTDRQLVVLRHLVGLDLAGAGREAGVTGDAAGQSLRTSAQVLADLGVDTAPAALATTLHRLDQDLTNVPADRGRTLRREGARRRRSRLLLAGLCSLALAIGAGALTVAQPVVPAGSNRPPQARPAPADAPDVTALQLLPARAVSRLDPERPWGVPTTSTDLGTKKPYDACLSAAPQDPEAEHLWVRTLEGGGDESPTQVSQAVEVSGQPEAAARSYRQIVTAFSVCEGSQIVDYFTIGGIGDQAKLITLRVVDHGRVQTQRVAIAQTGNAVTVWTVHAPSTHPVGAKRVTRLLGSSVNALCTTSTGSCGSAPYDVKREPPPQVASAHGFLSTIDLPVFDGVGEAWVATKPAATRRTPSATDCDHADFAAARARHIRARTYVIPNAGNLPTVFGMTETAGDFGNQRAAKRFVDDVSEQVGSCHHDQRSLRVRASDRFATRHSEGRVWDIRLVTSKRDALTFRVALVRVGSTAAQVTFTPSENVDVTHQEFVALADRAAERLGQS